MNSERWNLIKNNRYFNASVYNRGLMALIISLVLSGAFGVILFYIYISEPEPDYYATDGVTPPVPLTSMSAPNNSSRAMLGTESSQPSENKWIPQ